MATAELVRAERAPVRAAAPAAVPGPHRSGYIVAPAYDLLFFILSPLIALGLGIAISGSRIALQPVGLLGESWTVFFIGSFTMAHLFLVFFRSHGNREILATYPFRFKVVPPALFAILVLSPWLLTAAWVLVAFWDVYHSGMQTFGLGRIYDRLQGNDPGAGRRLDILLNHLLYAGPIVAGITLLDHMQAFYTFDRVGSAFLTSVPALARGWHADLALAVIFLGVPFLAYYVFAYVRLARNGYRVSPQKVALLTATGLCSIWSWGFNSFGEAFFIMNFFHALQYFALVGYSERKNLARRFHLGQRWLPLKLSALLLGLGFAYGAWAELLRPQLNSPPLWLSVTLTVSLLHFWYDGFIWSVRLRQV